MAEAPRTRMVLAAYLDQNGLCVYCKGPVNQTNATWEHVIPRGWGGPESGYNIVLACADCNGIKSGIESLISNMDRQMDLSSRAALFILRCSVMFRGPKQSKKRKPLEWRMRFFRMANDMLIKVDYHMGVLDHEVPTISPSERGKFL